MTPNKFRSHLYRAALAVALTLAPMAQAEEAERTTCQRAGDLAVTIMTNRQFGERMSDMMGRLEGYDLAQRMVIDAYEQWEGWDMAEKQNQIFRFRERWELWCYQQIQG